MYVLSGSARLAGSGADLDQGLGGFNPFAGMQGMNNLNDPNAVCSFHRVTARIIS